MNNNCFGHGTKERWISVVAAAILLFFGIAQAQQPDGRRPDELKTYLDLESKETNVKLDQILHQLYDVNQKIVTLSFM